MSPASLGFEKDIGFGWDDASLAFLGYERDIGFGADSASPAFLGFEKDINFETDNASPALLAFEKGIGSGTDSGELGIAGLRERKKSPSSQDSVSPAANQSHQPDKPIISALGNK